MDWKNKIEMIVNKLKLQLHSKKLDDLESVYRKIEEFDPNHSGRLERDSFQKMLGKIGIFLSTQEMRALSDEYDQLHDGYIHYPQFIEQVRSSMSAKRLAVVKHAFEFLDCGHSGALSFDQLVESYRAE